MRILRRNGRMTSGKWLKLELEGTMVCLYLPSLVRVARFFLFFSVFGKNNGLYSYKFVIRFPFFGGDRQIV